MSKDRAVGSVFEDVSSTISNQQCFAYHLGVLVQVAYKHSCAQRSEKFFHAIKKMERNSRKFVNLQLSKQAKRALSQFSNTPDEVTSLTVFSHILSKAFLILLEFYKNCIECVGHSLDQLHIEHFISLHMLLIALCSNLRVHVQTLLTKIETWYKDISVYVKQFDVSLPALPHTISKDLDLEIEETPKLKVSSTLQKLFGDSVDPDTSCVENVASNQDCKGSGSPQSPLSCLQTMVNKNLKLSNSFEQSLTDESFDLGTVLDRASLPSLLQQSPINARTPQMANDQLQLMPVVARPTCHYPLQKSKYESTPRKRSAANCMDQLKPEKPCLRHKKNAKRKLGNIGNLCNTPLKYKKYHYSFFKLCKRRKLR